MNCMAHIVKYILYIFNLIFVICGILLITLGSIMLSNIGDIDTFDDAVNIATIPILILVLGCLIFVISFLGCCGALKENVCFTTTYAVCMFILFCLQIALVVWIFVQQSQFLVTMGKVVEEIWNKNDQANGYPMQGIEIGFKCCGLNGYRDYVNANQAVPSSCCGSRTGACPPSTYELRNGCQNEFDDFWSSNMNIIKYAGIGVAVVELVAFTFACCLASSIKKSRH